MRRILIENARRKQSRRHGGGRRRLDLDTVNPGTKPRDEELLALDEESQPGEYTHAVSLAVLALARHQRQQPEAQAALEEASQLITRLHEDPSTKGHHDLVIAEILVREAKTLINGVAD
jgi:hypothetical protein